MIGAPSRRAFAQAEDVADPVDLDVETGGGHPVDRLIACRLVRVGGRKPQDAVFRCRADPRERLDPPQEAVGIDLRH